MNLKNNIELMVKLANRMPNIVKHENGMYTLNGLIHTLKHYLHMEHCCLASETGQCISDISKTYVPTRQLAHFVKVTEFDIENNVIYFEWIEHPTKGKYGI